MRFKCIFLIGLVFSFFTPKSALKCYFCDSKETDCVEPTIERDCENQYDPCNEIESLREFLKYLQQDSTTINSVARESIRRANITSDYTHLMTAVCDGNKYCQKVVYDKNGETWVQRDCGADPYSPCWKGQRLGYDIMECPVCYQDLCNKAVKFQFGLLFPPTFIIQFFWKSDARMSLKLFQ